MRIRLEDGSTRLLGASHFVATGGEATVYAVGGEAYKIYTDPDRALSASKRAELSVLEHPSIIRPSGEVWDPDSDRVVGIRMPYVSGAQPLASLMARSARERHGLDDRMALELMSRLQEVVSHCHAHGVQIVDLNTMNILVRTGHGEPELFCIDVDSWQTPGHPATALQDAVRDRRAPSGVFGPETDWFSYAVVATHFLLGIHPYRGKHPTLHGLDSRMGAQVSVFDPAVRLPPVARATSILPSPWRAWVERILETDFRGSPPPLVAPPHPRPDVAAITEHRMSMDPPRGPWVLTRAPRSGQPVRVVLEECRLRIHTMDGTESVPCGLHVDAISACGGRVHIRSGGQILELQLHESGRRLLATAVPRAQVLAHATHLFDGVAVQDLLGTAWITRLDRPATAPQLRVEALDGLRVVHASVGRDSVRLWVDAQGTLDRLDLVFDGARGVTWEWSRDVELPGESIEVEYNPGRLSLGLG